MDPTSPTVDRSLYRKYRSRSFSDLVGQEHVTQTLRNAVRSGAVGHAYLFTGTRGTGKTSVARILARAVNCEHPQDGEACDVCPSCLQTSGNCLDIVEIDAASHGGVDDARDLRERVNFAPVAIKRKVYIIDEAHMLSPQANDALLKTLEEPPAHVLFVLATTDVHKVKVTVASRCQRLDFRRLTPREIESHLAYVCTQEGMQAEPAALALLAVQADGSLRDALSLLDQVRAYEGHLVGVTQVEQALGLARSETLSTLMDCIVAGDAGGALALIDNLAAAGADMRQYAKQLVQYWRDLMLLCAGGATSLGRAPDARMAEQASRLSVADVTAIFKAIMQPDYSGRRSASAQWQIELAVVEACQHFAGSGQLARPAAAARTAESKPAAEAPRPPRAGSTTEPMPRQPAPPPGQPAKTEPSELSMAEIDAALELRAEPVLPAVEAQPAPVLDGNRRDGAAGVAAETRSPEQLWREVVRALNGTPETRRVAAFFKDSCAPVGFAGDSFVVGFFPQYSLLKDQAEKPANRGVVQEALNRVLGRAVGLRYDTIKEAPAGNGSASASVSDSFIRRAEREILSVHMERDTR